MISANVLQMSVGPVKTITSMELCYPRFIHAELMTHRVFSRNASSSRAVPIDRMIRDTQENPAMPNSWMQNKPGMQGGDVLGAREISEAKDAWIKACNDAVKHARVLKDLGCHKQIVNRILEPFAHIKVIVTATEWDNFFMLRLSEQAEPNIRELAQKMQNAMFKFEPQHVGTGGLHAPYVHVDTMISQGMSVEDICMASAGRCARVSYLNHDGTKADVHQDIMLARRLLTDKHASVFEHQAFALSNSVATDMRSRNFYGWTQFRERVNL